MNKLDKMINFWVIALYAVCIGGPIAALVTGAGLIVKIFAVIQLAVLAGIIVWVYKDNIDIKFSDKDGNEAP